MCVVVVLSLCIGCVFSLCFMLCEVLLFNVLDWLSCYDVAVLIVC